MNLTAKQIYNLREFCKFTCEECGHHEGDKTKDGITSKLTPHRLRRGCAGGKYILRNIKMVCSDCHKRYHYNEF